MDLNEFIVRANRATYAGYGNEEMLPSRACAHDLLYREGEYEYLDSYFGSGCFSGEAIVWRDKLPIWSMNYYGQVTGDGFSGDFLKAALRRVPVDKPFRGPELYEDGGYRYTCTVSGDISFFSGEESIFLDGVKIYGLFFHGGKIE